MIYQKGLTLLELLVVLLLTTMISAFLFDTGSNLAGLFIRIDSVSEDVQRKRVAASWLRDAIGSSVASHQIDAQQSFVGSPTSLAGLTMMPILGEQGKLARFYLDLVDRPSGTSVRYRQDDRESFELIEWMSQARLLYVNSKGREFSDWPPEAGLTGSLPSLVIIEPRSGIPLKIKIQVRRLPVVDLRDQL